MRTIWKFEIGVGISDVSMPRGAEVLSVACQHGHLVLWAVVDPNLQTYTLRKFHAVLTGQDFWAKPAYRFVDTVLMSGGAFVVHVFEVTS